MFLSFFISFLVWPFKPNQWKCRGFLLRLITLGDPTHSLELPWRRNQPACNSTTHNIHNRQTSMSLAGFEPAILTSEGAADRRLRRRDHLLKCWKEIISFGVRDVPFSQTFLTKVLVMYVLKPCWLVHRWRRRGSLPWRRRQRGGNAANAAYIETCMASWLQETADCEVFVRSNFTPIYSPSAACLWFLLLNVFQILILLDRNANYRWDYEWKKEEEDFLSRIWSVALWTANWLNHEVRVSEWVSEN
jgi:hypothetical protein